MKPYQIDTHGLDFTLWKISHDANGNPRYVVHYLTIPYQEDETVSFYINQAWHIDRAKKALNGSKYRAKWFGGGIVFSTYSDPIKYVQDAINASERV